MNRDVRARKIPRAHRHRRAQAARLRHRHLRPEPAAAAGAAGRRAPSTSCCAASTTATAVDELGPRFRAVIETAGNYSVTEQFAIPMALRREAAELFHAPHYVLPPLTPCRSVVTIHDCIHLLFPQYLPSRLGYAYARAQMWTATHQRRRASSRCRKRRSATSCASSACPNRRSTSSTTPSTSASGRSRPPRRWMRVRERYQLDRPVRPLRRQHQAAQEPRAADRSVPPAAPEQPAS